MEDKVCQEGAAVSAVPSNTDAADKQARKKIFTIIYAVVLVAAFIGTVQLLYNAIDYFVHTPYQKNSTSIQAIQIPLAVILLMATLVSIAFITLLVAALCKKSSKTKRDCFIASIACASALLILVLACYGFWATYYNEEYGEYMNNPIYDNRYDDQLPRYVAGTNYVLYSGVMALLVPQLMYVAVLAALHIWDFVKTQKDNKAASQSVAVPTASAPIAEPEVTAGATDNAAITAVTADSETAQ